MKLGHCHDAPAPMRLSWLTVGAGRQIIPAQCERSLPSWPTPGSWAGHLRAFRSLGVNAKFVWPAAEIWEMQNASASGAVLSRVDLRFIGARPGTSSFIVHRRELLAALEAVVWPGTVQLGVTCCGVRQTESNRVSSWTPTAWARSAPARCWAPDGLRSVVRASIIGEELPRCSGETCCCRVAS
jgi:hypothetical protein